MFEYDGEIVNSLLKGNSDFQYLYRVHNDLKEKVHKAEMGELPMDDATLGTMKKEKLLAKDRLAAMIEEYRREHA